MIHWHELHRQALREAVKGHQLNEHHKTSELLNYTFAPVTPSSVNWRTPRPGANWRIGLYEGLALVAGVQDPAIADTLGKLGEFKDGGAFHGAYGPRARAGLLLAYRAFWSDGYSRRVFVPVYTVNDLVDGHHGAVKDTPCTLGFSFWRSEGTLHMTTIMRSWDLWWGLPYDVPMFAMLHASMAFALADQVGEFNVFAINTHLYDGSLRAALEWTKRPSEALYSHGEPLAVALHGPWEHQREVAVAALEHLRAPERNSMPEGAAPWLEEALTEWHT